MSHQLTARRILVASVVVAASACSRFRGHSNPGGAAPAPSRPTTAAAPARRAPAKNAPTDANIAAILLAANNTDISYARLAPSRASSRAVKDFAQAMLTDHSTVNQTVMDLLNGINLSPEDNVTSLDFRDESANKRDIMRELSGRAFDTTYMANEVSYHTRLLAEIDNSLAPSARNPQLVRTISAIRGAVAAHLEHAVTVRAQVAGGR
jgi:putative membrane protein